MANATLLALAAVFSSISAGAMGAEPSPPSGTIDREAQNKANAAFEAKAMKLREAELLKLEPSVVIPDPSAPPRPKSAFPWKTGIVTTVFWVGRDPDSGAGQTSSAWDPDWARNFGGFDDPLPAHRKDFIPAKFVPRLNPFYVALPYNDVAGGKAKPEAKDVIPWFKQAIAEDGKSVCRDQWVEIRNAAGKVCFAQWSDCGPYLTDHWQYVFGNERPKPNASQGAGLNVSPAIRDFLGLSATDVTDWKFVNLRDVSNGPWAEYGDNNQFLRMLKTMPISGDKDTAPPATPVP